MMVLSRHSVNDSRPPAIESGADDRQGDLTEGACRRGAEIGRGLFQRFVETGKTCPHDQRDQRRRVQRLADPQPQDAVVDRPDLVVERATDAYEPAEQGDRIHDLGRDEDEEQHEHERLAPRTSAPGQATPASPPRVTAMSVPPIAAVNELRNARPETGLVEQVGVPVGAHADDDDRDSYTQAGIAQCCTT